MLKTFALVKKFQEHLWILDDKLWIELCIELTNKLFKMPAYERNYNITYFNLFF